MIERAHKISNDMIPFNQVDWEAVFKSFKDKPQKDYPIPELSEEYFNWEIIVNDCKVIECKVCNKLYSVQSKECPHCLQKQYNIFIIDHINLLKHDNIKSGLGNN